MAQKTSERISTPSCAAEHTRVQVCLPGGGPSGPSHPQRRSREAPLLPLPLPRKSPRGELAGDRAELPVLQAAEMRGDLGGLQVDREG